MARFHKITQELKELGYEHLGDLGIKKMNTDGFLRI